MDNAIQVTGLTKHFQRSNIALHDISLRVDSGEMVSLIGPSGSGKSTFLRHLSGLTLADNKSESNITVCGQNIQRDGHLNKHIRRHRSNIGLIFQQFNLVRRLSVLTNVLLGGLSHMPWHRSCFALFNRDEKQQALAALERVGLADFAWQKAENLSGGQQQRVAIARALMQKASVILADEPIASLDPASAKQVMDILRDINREDKTTVIITLHQVDYAIGWCDRLVALKQGKIWFDLPVNEVSPSKFSALYGQSETLSEVPSEMRKESKPVKSRTSPRRKARYVA